MKDNMRPTPRLDPIYQLEVEMEHKAKLLKCDLVIWSTLFS